MKIALGTVQFGLEYGVANQAGRVSFDDVGAILRQAAAHGIDTLDTAIAYGDSEQTLGKARMESWHLVTKLPPVPAQCADVGAWIDAQIEGSLARLGVRQLHGVLLHQPMQLLGEHGEQLAQGLQRIKAAGIARKIGVSVYAPEELDLLAGTIPFELVQAPLNLVDRRLIESGWANKLKSQGTEIHVRSAFLQGLLLLPSDKRPGKFDRFGAIWSEWSRWLDATGLTPLQACLAYVMRMAEIDKVVVGVDSVKQLNEIFDACRSQLPNLPQWELPVPADLINPARWSAL